MVEGADRLKRRFAAIPPKILAGARQEIEKVAAQVVAQMDSIKPLPEIQIGWTWGKVPAGGMQLGEVKGGGRVAVRIFATAFPSDYPRGSQGFPALARWWEFGTAERHQKTTGRSTGRIPAQPYFFPTYRSNKRTAQNRIRSRVRRDLKGM